MTTNMIYKDLGLLFYATPKLYLICEKFGKGSVATFKH